MDDKRPGRQCRRCRGGVADGIDIERVVQAFDTQGVDFQTLKIQSYPIGNGDQARSVIKMAVFGLSSRGLLPIAFGETIDFCGQRIGDPVPQAR